MVLGCSDFLVVASVESVVEDMGLVQLVFVLGRLLAAGNGLVVLLGEESGLGEELGDLFTTFNTLEDVLSFGRVLLQAGEGEGDLAAMLGGLAFFRLVLGANIDHGLGDTGLGQLFDNYVLTGLSLSLRVDVVEELLNGSGNVALLNTLLFLTLKLGTIL